MLLWFLAAMFNRQFPSVRILGQDIERNIFPSLVSIPSVLVEKKTEILKLMEDGYQVMAIAHPTLQIK
jgi:hypothetical protein